ncbi:hypothetical protein Tco_1423231, partial [Tanacetum coccineum]
SVGLRWIPTGKLFDSCTSKDDSEPTNGSNIDIPNIHESKQTLDLSAGTSINVQKEQSFDLSAGEPSQPVLIRNQLKSDGDICMYALTVSTMELKSVNKAMTDPAWIESMQEELLQFKRLDVWVLVSSFESRKATYVEVVI